MVSPRTSVPQNTHEVSAVAGGDSGLPWKSARSSTVEDRPSRVFRVFGIVGFLILVIPGFLILLEIITPWPVTWFVERICGPICHHLSERTITLGNPMPVCARCAGLYCGWLVVSVLPFIISTTGFEVKCAKTSSLWIGFALLFVVSFLEAGLETFGWVKLANWPRFAMGVPLGLFPASLLLFGVKTLEAETRRSDSCSPVLVTMRFERN